MTGKVLYVDTVWSPDNIATNIAKYWQTWNSLRADQIAQWKEIRNYRYATDTRSTSNAHLPWKNTTTIPKLCQIAENLEANYMYALFPKRKSVYWDADDKSSNTYDKVRSIAGYMQTVIDHRGYKDEQMKCIHDWVMTGNAFIMPEWVDQRVQVKSKPGKVQVGYVGPGSRRISPDDIVFNPTAPSFDRTPKIVRSLVSMGEVKELLDSLSTDDNRKAYEELWQYMLEFRNGLRNSSDDMSFKEQAYAVDGFGSYRNYIESDVCEILTFYGDLFNRDDNKFLKNHIIMVVDRHKIIAMEENPSFFGTAPIRHIAWRTRPDNLWGMSPLANLVGMQYRIDHMENAKADVLDLIVFPVLKIKGFVQDFKWEPFARIQTDEEGDVQMLAPPFQVLQVDQEIQFLMALMEELAGAPKEAMGFRTPGEKTKFEVSRMENAASRIFNAKIQLYEEFFVEPHLNDLLELGRRKSTSDILIKYWDDSLKIAKFLDLQPSDIEGNGRIRPMAARHFVEQAELIQNLNGLFMSPLGQDPGFKAHWSTIKLAQKYEKLFDLCEDEIVLPFVRMAEEADAQRIANAQMEQVYMEAMESTGLTPDDTGPQPGDPAQAGPPVGGPPGMPPAASAPGGPPSPFQVGPGFPGSQGQPGKAVQQSY